ncbi:hypothetical protein ACFX1T_042659 [Malus domestica]
MYAKCGNIEDAYHLFRKMDVRNVALWNAMLVGLAQHGNAKEALSLFRVMKTKNIEPDRVTFIGVLSACSHSGLVSEAFEYFSKMQKDYGVEPEMEHYFCLSNARRVKGETETGKRVAVQLLAVEPSNSSAYVPLSSIYAAAAFSVLPESEASNSLWTHKHSSIRCHLVQLPAIRPIFFEQMDFVANHFWVTPSSTFSFCLWYFIGNIARFRDSTDRFGMSLFLAYVETGLEEGLYFFSAFHWSGLRLDDVSVRSVLRGIDKVDSYRCKRHTEQTLSEYVKAGENWAADCCTVFERLFCLFIEKSVQSRERSGLNFGELNDIMMCAKWFRKEANKLKFNLASWNAMMFGYVMWDDGQMAKFKIFRGEHFDVWKAHPLLTSMTDGKREEVRVIYFIVFT